MDDKYEIYESDYDEYLLNNGLQSIGTSIEREIKDGNARYYVIKKNNELSKDFALYPNKNNLITLSNVFLKNVKLTSSIIEQLSEYAYISVYLFYEERDKDNYEIIKENFKIVKEIDLVQGISNIKQVCFTKKQFK